MGIGKVINDIRKQKKYTLEDLREISGISPSYLSGINNDKQDLPLRTLNKIAEALEVNPSYIMEINEIEYGIENNKEKYSLQKLLKILKDFDTWPEKDQEEVFNFVKKVKEIKDSRK